MNKLQHKRKMRQLANQRRELEETVGAVLSESMPWLDAIWARTLIDHAKANNSHWLNDRGVFG